MASYKAYYRAKLSAILPDKTHKAATNSKGSPTETSIECLPGLSGRTVRCLRNGGILTAGQLSKTPAKNLHVLRGYGTTTHREVCLSLKRHGLPVPGEHRAASNSTDLQSTDSRSDSSPTSPSSPLLNLELPEIILKRAAAIPIEELTRNLDSRAQKVLRSTKCKTLLDVTLLTAKQLLSLNKCGPKTIIEIKIAALEKLLQLESDQHQEEPGQLDVPLREATTTVKTAPDLTAEPPSWTSAIEATAAGLRKYVEELLETLDTRSAQVIMGRYGLWEGEKNTLEHVAAEMGVSKERVRQLQSVGEFRIRRMAKVSIPQIFPRFGKAIFDNYLMDHHGMATEQELLEEGVAAWGDEARRSIEFLQTVDDTTIQLMLSGYQKSDEGIIFQDTEIAAIFTATLVGIKTTLENKEKHLSPEECISLTAQALAGIKPGFIRRCAEVSPDAASYIGLRKMYLRLR